MEQLILIILIALISFIHWVIQKSGEARERRRAQRQAQGGGELLQRPEEPPPLEPQEDSAESMRRLMEALGLPLESEPPPVVTRRAAPSGPPPLPQPIQREVPPAPVPSAPAHRPVPAGPAPVMRTAGPQGHLRPDSAGIRQPAPALPTEVARVRRLLATGSGLRDAIVLSEILGPPKSLRA